MSILPSPSSSSSSSSLSSSSNMGRSCFKIGLSMAFVFVLVYMTWHFHVPRYTREDPLFKSEGNGRTGANFKTNSMIGQDQQYLYTENRLLANGESDYEEDSAFPFPDNEDVVDEGNEEEEEEEDVSTGRIQTYFSAVNVSFSDVHIGPHNTLPTLPFLEACQATTQLFDKMHKTILDKVVQDIRGNIEKIRLNHDLAPAHSKTIQGMVARDLARGVMSLPDDEWEGTSLLAITWLKRAFTFLSRFLSYIDAGKEQRDAASKAYQETLRQYHGFALRTVFNAAFYTLSTRSAFLRELAVNESDVDLPGFEKTAMKDLRKYNSALTRRLRILEDFFNEHGIKN